MRFLRTWRPIDGTLLGLLLLLALIAAREVWVSSFQLAWRDEEQSHILIAAPIALWLLWIRRQRLMSLAPSWSPLGAVTIALAWLLGEYGLQTARDVYWHLSALLLVWGAFLTVMGPRLMLRFLVPLGATLALLPIPGFIRLQIAEPLQNISATCTQYLLDIAGVPVARSGNLLLINGQRVAIAEACNGMRMVAALGLVAYAFAFSIPVKPAVRALILLMSPLLAVLVNILRLMPTVLFYGYTNDGVAKVFHDLSGWAMMALALGMLWAFMRLLRWMELPVLSYGAMRE
ncbi:MAG: exosortase/archaeosortase family protein [Planctomycetota bacterium]